MWCFLGNQQKHSILTEVYCVNEANGLSSTLLYTWYFGLKKNFGKNKAISLVNVLCTTLSKDKNSF